MKSRASIKSHPLHPLLIAFPIAFFTGTLVFDVWGEASGRDDLHHIAYYLQISGIVLALVAAVPGIIDYIYTVPPQSSGKKRAAKHGLINVTNVVLFTVIWFYRQNDHASPWLIIGLEALGFILLCSAGWLGGTLVYRNLVGVDMRYANAGKWKESTPDQNSGQIEVAASDELKLNQMKLIRLNDKRIALARSEQGYVAFDDRCTHRGGSLAGGAMICGTVQCPWHGSQFDVHQGIVKAGPAKEPIHTYSVTEKDGKVYINL